MTIEMTDKQVTSFRFNDFFKKLLFNWFFNQFYVLYASLEVTSVWGVSAVAILDSSVNCVCVWSTKKLTMPVYCVASNCNDLQTTPGITMHELPCN